MVPRIPHATSSDPAPLRSAPDPEFRPRVLEMLGRLLAREQTIQDLGGQLCRQLQPLTGAEMAAFYRCQRHWEGRRARCLQIHPAGGADRLAAPGVELLVDSIAGHSVTRLHRLPAAGDPDGRPGPLALAAPLQDADGRVFLLLLLGLAEDESLVPLQEAMETLSTLLALALRHGPLLASGTAKGPTLHLVGATGAPAVRLLPGLEVGVFRLDAAGRMVHADDRFRDAHGLSAADEGDPDWLAAVHPADSVRIRTEWRLSVAQKRGLSLTYRACNRAGRVAWLTLLSTPELDGLGRVNGFVGLVAESTGLCGEEASWRSAERTGDGAAAGLADESAAAPAAEPARGPAGGPDCGELQVIQDTFCEGLGVNGVITDLEGTPWTRPHLQPGFCSVVRSTATGRALCRLADGVAMPQVPEPPRSGEGGCLACRLLRGSAEICLAGRPIARWTIGQSRLPEADEETVCALALRIGADPEELRRSYVATPRLSDQAFARIFKLQRQMARDFAELDQTSLGLTLDLAELVRLEEDRRRTEESYRNLFTAMQDGFALHETVCDGEGQPVDYRFLDVNPAFERIFARRRSELVGHTAREVFPTLETFWVDTIGRVARDGRSVKFEHEFPDCGLCVEVLAYRVEPGRVAAVIRDTTESRRAEERVQRLNEALEERVGARTLALQQANAALMTSEARYRRLIESLRGNYYFYSLDPAGGITYLSESVQDILGYTPQEFRERSREILAENPLSGVVRRRREACLKGENQPPCEVEVRCRDGTTRTLEVLEVAVRDGQGRVISVEGIAQDVTEKKRNQAMIQEAHAQLMEAEKLAALGSLVAGVAHEISTPVGIGVTAASLLRQEAETCHASYRAGRLKRSGFEQHLGALREAAGMIEANLQRAADLIQSFKLVAVDQTSRERRRFPLKAYLEEILLSLGPKLKRSGHRVVVDCPEDLELDGYPGALFQVMTNLVLNSLRHAYAADEHGTLQILAVRQGDELCLSFRDDGCGMPPEVRRRVFEPFFTTGRSCGGSGLGLHITYNLVTQTMGGRIQCLSEPGLGTTFVVTVPLQVEGRDD